MAKAAAAPPWLHVGRGSMAAAAPLVPLGPHLNVFKGAGGSPPRQGSRPGNALVRARNVFGRRHVDCWHPNSRLKTRSRGVGRPEKWCGLAVTPSCACRPPPPTVCRGAACPPRPRADGRLPRTTRPLAPARQERPACRPLPIIRSRFGLLRPSPPLPVRPPPPRGIAAGVSRRRGGGERDGGGVWGHAPTRPSGRGAPAAAPAARLCLLRVRHPAATGGRGGGCVGDGAWFWGCARGGAA